MAAVSGCSDGEMKSCGKGDYAEIVVIRHGQTEWNASHRVQGQVDVKLNDVGRKQAVAVATRLSGEPKISVVYSSDLDRAHETAKMIASRCGGIEVIKDPDLRERHMGDLQGLAFPEIHKVNPVSFKALKSGDKDQEIPGGGESINQLYNRCTSSIQRIAKKHKGERVVVVTHGGLIESLHRRASLNELPRGIGNTSVSVFHVSDDEWLIQSWGDISHLKETKFLEPAFGGNGISA